MHVEQQQLSECMHKWGKIGMSNRRNPMAGSPMRIWHSCCSDKYRSEHQQEVVLLLCKALRTHMLTKVASVLCQVAASRNALQL